MEDFDVNTPPRAKFTDQGLSIPATPFLERLGYGTGVNVWSLKTSQSPWAVKNVRNAIKESDQKNYQKLIDKEAAVLKTISHENIIGFRAFLPALDGRHCLAMESGGKSLGELIENKEEIFPKLPFTPKEILKVTNSVAKALHYLHTEKMLLHGDIKSYNILVKGDFDEIKLCDLGVCVELDDNGRAKGNSYVGTFVYNAPEVINPSKETPITGLAEVFSLGLVMWEMMALSPPHCYGTDSESTIMLDSSCNDSMLSLDSSISVPGAGTRPTLPPGLGPEFESVIGLFNICTEQRPDDRPTALNVASLSADMLAR